MDSTTITNPSPAQPAAARSIETPLGLMRAEATPLGIVRLGFVGDDPGCSDTNSDRGAPPTGIDHLDSLCRELSRYFAGKLVRFATAAAPNGTTFQHRVWNRLREIPFGETVSYGTLARRLGDPKATRAVARANAENPVAILVPCHRVIGADGTLTGYAGGLDRKRALLEIEGVHRLFTQRS